MWVWDLLKLIFSPNTVSLPAKKTNAQKLYDAAYAEIGEDASPLDAAPDEFGCAESLSNIIQKAFPEMRFPTLISTRTLYNYLLSSPSFHLTFVPSPGCIILAVTGTGNGSIPHGHCGVVGKQWIMSNNSGSGTWEANYKLDNWKRYFEKKGGMQTIFFAPV